jgi:hypothetical protein
MTSDDPDDEVAAEVVQVEDATPPPAPDFTPGQEAALVHLSDEVASAVAARQEAVLAQFRDEVAAAVAGSVAPVLEGKLDEAVADLGRTTDALQASVPAAVADRVGTSVGGIMVRRLESLARRMEAELDTSQRILSKKIADLVTTHQVTWQGQQTSLADLPAQVAAAVGARIAAPVEELATSVPARLASTLEQRLVHQRRDLESRFSALSEMLERRTTVVERLGATLERLVVTLERRASHSESATTEGFQILDAGMAGVVQALSGAAEAVKGIGAQVGELGTAVAEAGGGIGALASEVGELRARLEALAENQAAGFARADAQATQAAQASREQEAGLDRLAASVAQAIRSIDAQGFKLGELTAEVTSRKGRRLL